MCILIVVRDKFPTLDFLKLSESKNRDGGGIAYTSGEEVKWKKGLTADQIYKYKGKIPTPFIIHFRAAPIAAGALKGPEHCHPFPVTADVSLELEGKADKALAHNGSWTDFRNYVFKLCSATDKLYEGPATDTRGIAWLYYRLGDVFLQLLGQKVAVIESKKVKCFGVGWKSKDTLMVSNDPTGYLSVPKSEDAWAE